MPQSVMPHPIQRSNLRLGMGRLFFSSKRFSSGTCRALDIRQNGRTGIQAKLNFHMSLPHINLN